MAAATSCSATTRFSGLTCSAPRSQQRVVAIPKRGSRYAVSVRASAQFGAGLNPELRKTIDTVINTNKVVVFIKGTKQFPQCGFSNTVCQILTSMSIPFESVNILADDRLRSGMKEYSQWPTFPQVYVGGEFVGGADIMISMFQSGELAELFERELNS